MKRTVWGWALIHERHPLSPLNGIQRTPGNLLKWAERAKGLTTGRFMVEYDDGKPANRKARKK